MNFNSIEFLALFLPITFATFYLVPLSWRLWVLSISSLIFYGVSGLEVLAAFIIAILWGYATAFLFGRWPRWLALIIAISVPMFFLIMFKYLNFILGTVQAGEQTRNYFWVFFSILLPAGISFYTFEIVSYSIDVADKKIGPERSLIRFTAFATFFPHLIAGPIMRYHDLCGQLRALQETPVLSPRLMGGLKLLSIGLFGKIFASDVCAMFIVRADSVQLDQLTGPDILTKTAFWSMQIYYDFWAYSLMAIGLGRLFCIELPVNFRQPYLSANPREFWRRWHVTLSLWLRDYVYIKMGGRERYVRNILIVFAACGLWHGAGWNFVVWGIFHGVMVIGYHFTAPYWDRLPKVLAIAVTFTLVSFAWPLFFLSLHDYAAFLGQLGHASWTSSVYQPIHWAYLALLGIVTFAFNEEKWLYNDPEKRGTVMDWPSVSALMFFVGLMFISLSRTFIYFRF
jgi:alginate O-acetyltransferase complex protein AlgI